MREALETPVAGTYDVIVARTGDWSPAGDSTLGGADAGSAPPHPPRFKTAFNPAASIAIERGVAIAEVPIGELQSRLEETGITIHR